MILSLYLISFFCFTRVIAETGVFCNAKNNDWKVCRTCNDITKKCEEDPSGCYCENIEIQNKRTKNLTGGSDCKDGFCYVSKYSQYHYTRKTINQLLQRLKTCFRHYG